MSTVLIVLILAYNMVITPIRYIINVHSIVALGNNGNINLSIPYKLNFKTIFFFSYIYTYINHYCNSWERFIYIYMNITVIYYCRGLNIKNKYNYLKNFWIL